MLFAIALVLALPQEPPDIVQYRGAYANPTTGLCFSVPVDWVAEDVPGTTDTHVGGPLYGPGGTWQPNVVLTVERTSEPTNLRLLTANLRTYLRQLWQPNAVAGPTFAKNKRGTPTAQIVHIHPSEQGGEPIKTIYLIALPSSHVYVYARATASVRAWPEYGTGLTLILSTLSKCASAAK
jgi:hypothetical protein